MAHNWTKSEGNELFSLLVIRLCLYWPINQLTTVYENKILYPFLQNIFWNEYQQLSH